MSEPSEAVPEVYLQPGESYLARKPMLLRTLLGSCVGATFFSARLGIGALCHAQLPRSPKNPPGGLTVANGRRFVDFAIRDLARQFDELGARRTETQVKLFGGGDVLLVSEKGWKRPTVGKLNCEAALEVLQEEGYTVVASSIGGNFGLNIQFHTGSGEVRLRRLS
jgi:chemotaxis protein CheD